MLFTTKNAAVHVDKLVVNDDNMFLVKSLNSVITKTKNIDIWFQLIIRILQCSGLSVISSKLFMNTALYIAIQPIYQLPSY